MIEDEREEMIKLSGEQRRNLSESPPRHDSPKRRTKRRRARRSPPEADHQASARDFPSVQLMFDLARALTTLRQATKNPVLSEEIGELPIITAKLEKLLRRQAAEGLAAELLQRLADLYRKFELDSAIRENFVFHLQVAFGGLGFRLTETDINELGIFPGETRAPDKDRPSGAVETAAALLPQVLSALGFKNGFRRGKLMKTRKLSDQERADKVQLARLLGMPDVLGRERPASLRTRGQQHWELERPSGTIEELQLPSPVRDTVTIPFPHEIGRFSKPRYSSIRASAGPALPKVSREQWAGFVQSLGLPSRQTVALLDCFQREIAEIEYEGLNNVDHSVATRELSELHRRGLIERRGSHSSSPAYRAVIEVLLTTHDGRRQLAARMVQGGNGITRHDYDSAFGSTAATHLELDELITRGVLIVEDGADERFYPGISWAYWLLHG